MTPVELARLRDQVARARALEDAGKPVKSTKSTRSRKQSAGDAALAALALAEKTSRSKRRCAYCGYPATSRRKVATCDAHSDLPALDPAYNL